MYNHNYNDLNNQLTKHCPTSNLDTRALHIIRPPFYFDAKNVVAPFVITQFPNGSVPQRNITWENSEI